MRLCPSVDSNVEFILTHGWDMLRAWTQTGETVPYTNFNDYLHYYGGFSN